MFPAVLLQPVHLDISGVVGQPGPQRMEKVVELGRLLLRMEVSEERLDLCRFSQRKKESVCEQFCWEYWHCEQEYVMGNSECKEMI